MKIVVSPTYDSDNNSSRAGVPEIHFEQIGAGRVSIHIEDRRIDIDGDDWMAVCRAFAVPRRAP